MTKNILQDVMPPKKRSIRDIPLSRKREDVSSANNLSDFSGPIEGIRSSEGMVSSKNNQSKKIWWFLGVIFLVLFLFVISNIFSGAKITLVPKQEQVEFSATFTAFSSSDSDKDTEDISYNVITLEETGSMSTSNLTEKDVDKKSSGEIIIFNDDSSAPQRLVINTRFETPEGLIYRIPKSVVVPGKTVVGGKSVPGSVVVTVYADSPGESYNIGLTDFTVPGFKGTDKFSKFYARSKTAMKGGYSGIMKMVDDSELKDMKQIMHEDLVKKLKESVYAQIPGNLILYEDGIFIDFESQDNIDLGDSVQVVEKGFLRAVSFDRDSLSQYLANNILPEDMASETLEISNIEDLNFSVEEKDLVSIEDNDSFDFDISGSANFIWTFDEEKMKGDFSGQPKKNVNIILANFSGIKEAEVSISPFWKRNFPQNVDKIKIEKVFSASLENL